MTEKLCQFSASCDSFNKTSKELSEKDVEIDKKLCDLESRSMRENLIRARQRMLAELYCFWLVRLSVVTLTQSFLIGFIPNFIYGLLSSTFRSSSNTAFVPHPITKMANKMAATCQYPLSWSL